MNFGRFRVPRLDKVLLRQFAGELLRHSLIKNKRVRRPGATIRKLRRHNPRPVVRSANGRAQQSVLQFVAITGAQNLRIECGFAPKLPPVSIHAHGDAVDGNGGTNYESTAEVRGVRHPYKVGL